MLKSHIAGQPISTRQSRPRFPISARVSAQRRSRSLSDSVGYSVSFRMAVSSIFFSNAEFLQRRQIIRDALVQVVFGSVAKLVPRAGNVIDAGRRIREAIEIQAAADVHLRVRDVLLDDALEVAQRHADAGAYVVDAALHLVGRGREIDA